MTVRACDSWATWHWLGWKDGLVLEENWELTQRYPLVNVDIITERSSMFNGKARYFDWAIFNSYVKLPEGQWYEYVSKKRWLARFYNFNSKINISIFVLCEDVPNKQNFLNDILKDFCPSRWGHNLANLDQSPCLFKEIIMVLNGFCCPTVCCYILMLIDDWQQISIQCNSIFLLLLPTNI